MYVKNGHAITSRIGRQPANRATRASSHALKKKRPKKSCHDLFTPETKRALRRRTFVILITFVPVNKIRAMKWTFKYFLTQNIIVMF